MCDVRRIWAIRIPLSTGKRYVFAQVSFVSSCTSPYFTSAHRKTFSGISGGRLATGTRVFLIPTASMLTVDLSPFECLYCIWPSVANSMVCMRLLSRNFMYTCRFVMSICNMRMSCGNILNFSWIHSCISYAEMRALFTSKAHTIVFCRSFVRLRLILTALHRKRVVRLVGCKQAPHYTNNSSITLLHKTGPPRSTARRGMESNQRSAGL
jgi:hypothetical protein